jgi:tRNA threonylcarbamoyladenosine biosynthesis protein TsaB
MELTIDTASAVASVALSREGRLVAESTWQAGRGHAAELLPAIDRLLASADTDRSSITAVFVSRGPGAYAALRVGISTALALAFALDADVLGYGRLEADAFPFLGAAEVVCAVHDAGRREYAWAVYGSRDGGPVERVAPRIGPPEMLAASLPPGALIAGEVTLPLLELLPAGQRIVGGAAAMRRAGSGAALSWPRYAAGRRDSRLALTPLYLREPNITAPKPRPSASP